MAQANRLEEPSRREVPAGTMLPYFNLPSTRGETINPWRYKGRRDLVLLFADGVGCEPCQSMLRGLADYWRAHPNEEAAVFGVVAVSEKEARELAERLGLSFPLLADEDGAVHARFGTVAESGALAPAIFVADRYGEVQARWLAEAGHVRLPPPEEVFDSLRFIQIQCPE